MSLKEKKINAEKLRKQTIEVDYLAPFLAEQGLSDGKSLQPQVTADLKERCLADLKQRLIDKANLIQKRFEAVCFFKFLFANAQFNVFISSFCKIGKQWNAKETTMVSDKSTQYEQRRWTRIFRVLCRGHVQNSYSWTAFESVKYNYCFFLIEKLNFSLLMFNIVTRKWLLLNTKKWSRN